MALGYSWRSAAPPGGALRRATRRGWLRVEGSLGAVFGQRLNPFYHLGALTIFFFWIVLVSGIYLFIFFETSLSGAYSSVESLTRDQWYAGGVMRSLHRYASDAAVITMVLHLVREFAHDRYRGARWYSWFTGVPLLWLVYTLGITGYWLVWDQLAQYIAVGTAEFLDAMPIMTDPMARNFVSNDGVSDRFFTLLAFLHLLGIPLILVFAIWFHVLRITKPRVNPPRALLIGSLVALTALSLVKPAVSHPEADLMTAPGALHLDWFYLPAYPVMDLSSPALLWLVLLGGSVLLVALPWLPPHRAPVARVDLQNCNGCARCYDDCPYSAITMVARTDGKRHTRQPEVDPALCTSCGICAGACPSATPFRRASELVSGIELPYAPVQELRATAEEVIDAAPEDPAVLTVSCEQGPDLTAIEREGNEAVRVPCAGMLPPAFIDYAIRRRGAHGVFIVACRQGDCQYRFGDRWLEERLAGQREPHLKGHVDRARIRVFWGGRTDARAVQRAFGEFRDELRALESDADDAAGEAADGKG